MEKQFIEWKKKQTDLLHCLNSAMEGFFCSFIRNLSPSKAVVCIPESGNLILLMEEICKQPPEMHKTPVNNGIFTISTCAGFLPLTVCCKCGRRSCMTYISWLSQTRKPWRIWTETWWDQIKANDARLKDWNPVKHSLFGGSHAPSDRKLVWISVKSCSVRM